jgi:hypothetical protein
LQTAVITDDPYLAALLSCALAKRGTYVAVINGPRMSRSDRSGEVARCNNALARLKAKTTLLANLPEEAKMAMLAPLPKSNARVMSEKDVAELIANTKGITTPPLRWGRERIGIGLLKALYEQKMIEFFDESSPIENIKSRSGHLVVCEAGEPLSEVIAANYAYALGAGLYLIDKTDDQECKEILESYYSINAPQNNSGAERDRLQARLRELCQGIELPQNGSLTFITRGLPFGVAYPELPSTHLFTYPHLGISIINGFAAEQKGTRGVNIAALVDPQKVCAPEIEAAIKILPERGIFVRGYRGKGATVRKISEMVDLFPYDLLIFATHCGDAKGYRCTYEYKDSEGIDRRLIVDIAIGIANTDDPDMLRVDQFIRFHSLDGVDWIDPTAKKNLYVGKAIVDFSERFKANDLEPVRKDLIPRVVGSAAMAMYDNNYIALPRSLAAEGSPIIINNACVSWHELAKRFTFSGARVYVGTLYPVSDSEAEAVVTRIIKKYFEKPLPHAVWSAQNAVYEKSSTRRPYVVTGVYTQYLRVTNEDVPQRIFGKLKSAEQYWSSINKNKSAKDIASVATYYEREISSFCSRYLEI